jgi:hypothetical protein
MLKDSMSLLVILCLTTTMILSVATTAQKNMNITGNNLNVSNTLLNDTSSSNIETNNASQIDNSTKMGQAIDKTGHAKYTINLGSLAKKEINKAGKDLEKVVFICNIV